MGFYFDTVVTITLYGADDTLMEDIWAACKRYENMLSKTVEGSDVSRINNAHGQTVTVDAETWNVLNEAKKLNRLTGGAFAITIAPLTAQWDFTGGTNRMPTDEERIAALPLVDDEQLTLGENNTVTLPAGMQIDLGGIAKVGEKGQIVIPKDARQIFGVKPGDTLLILGDEETGIIVTKPDVLRDAADDIFGKMEK